MHTTHRPLTHPPPSTVSPGSRRPPDARSTDRLRPRLAAEAGGIDAVMFLITDARPANALIRAVGRGVPVRLYAEPIGYRHPNRRDDAYNVDRMSIGSVHIRKHSHAQQPQPNTGGLVTHPTWHLAYQ